MGITPTTVFFVLLVCAKIFFNYLGLPILYQNLFFGVFLLVAFLCFVEHFIYIVLPTRLIFQGNYDGSLDLYYRGWKKSILAKIDKVFRQNIMIGIAINYSRKGNFESSLKWLEKINEEKPATRAVRWYYSSLYANNLLLFKRNVKRAEEFINIALFIYPNHYFAKVLKLLECYLCLLVNKQEKATALVEEYIASQQSKPKKSLLTSFLELIYGNDEAYTSAAENFYLGYYYKALNDLEQARIHFKITASCPQDNFYKQKAKEYLNGISV